MTFDEMVGQILQVLPNAVLDQDNDGQVVIYTGVREDADGNIHKFAVTE